MSGRSGEFNENEGKYENIVYLPVTAKNDFKPELPKEKVDLIYLCFPNNLLKYLYHQNCIFLLV